MSAEFIRDFNDGSKGRAETSILEQDPTSGYTKQRTLFLDNGEEVVEETFSRSGTQFRSQHRRYDGALMFTDLSEVDKRSGIALTENEYGIHMNFFIPVSQPVPGEPNMGKVVLDVSYGAQRRIDMARMYTLPLHPSNMRRRRNNDDAKLRQELSKRIKSGVDDDTRKRLELIIKHINVAPEVPICYFMGFDTYSYGFFLDGGMESQELMYDKEYEVNERKFTVYKDNTRGLVQISQCLMTPSISPVQRFTSQFPLAIDKGRIHTQMRGPGKDWKNFFTDAHIQAQAA